MSCTVQLIVACRDPGQEESGEGVLAKKWADDGDDVRKGALVEDELAYTTVLVAWGSF